MVNVIKKWLPLLLVLSMIVLLLATAPAALAQTVEMGNTIRICDNYGGGYDKCSKYYIDYNMDLYAWGYNEDGNVGNGTKEYQATPCRILSNVVSVKAGSRVAGALTADGALYVWGFMYEPTPTRILENVQAFRIFSPCMIFAITDNGDLYTMGNTYSLIAGTGKKTYYTPQKVLSGVKRLEIDGNTSAFATCTSGNYYWGYGYGDMLESVPSSALYGGYITVPTRMETPPAGFFDTSWFHWGFDVQIGDFYNEGCAGGAPEGFKYGNGRIYYNNSVIMTNLQSIWGDKTKAYSYMGNSRSMYFFTKSGELYYGSIEDDYCIKLAEGIAMPYQKLEVGTKPGSGTETKIYLQVLDSKPTGSLDNFKKVNNYPSGKFTDVATDAWYAQNVKEAYELDLVKGVSDASFNPSGNITVAEAVTLAARLHSIYCTGKSEFVQGMPWYEAYFEYAFSNGIIDRYNFALDYNEVITRRDFARIFASAFPEGEDALEQINDIPDGSIPDVSSSQGFVYLLYRAGVLTGNDEQGTFAPNSSIKRSEVAAIVTRMAEPELRKNVVLK